MSLELHGYQYSVYAWIAKLALHEKGVDYNWVEIDPFSTEISPEFLALNPFGRVPVIVHNEFELYETCAITRYIDDEFTGLDLQPVSSCDRARVNQLISIADNYAYWPLVRQVFSQGVFSPRLGDIPDMDEYRMGLKKAPLILGALERLVGANSYLVGQSLTLADIHLGPMMSYFTSAPDGMELLRQHKLLRGWWEMMSVRSEFIVTKPILPEPII